MRCVEKKRDVICPTDVRVIGQGAKGAPWRPNFQIETINRTRQSDSQAGGEVVLCSEVEEMLMVYVRLGQPFAPSLR